MATMESLSKGIPVTEKEINVSEKRLSTPSIAPSMRSTRTARRHATEEFDAKMEAEEVSPVAQFFSELLDNRLIRYTLYIVPVAAILAIPLTLYCTIWKDESWVAMAKTNTTVIQAGSRTVFRGGSIINGTFANGTFVNGNLVNGTVVSGLLQNTLRVEVHKKGVMLWLELCWAFLWISKLIASATPRVFRMVVGGVAPAYRKYAEVLKRVKTPLSFLIWAVLCIAAYDLIYIFDRKSKKYFVGPTNPITGMITFHKVLKVSTGMAGLWLAEKLLVQLISLKYHSRSQEERIKTVKKSQKAIELLYDASLRRYPDYHPTMIDLDAEIHDSNGVEKMLGFRTSNHRAQRVAHKLRLVADKFSNAFHRIASDVAGQDVSDRTGAHAIIEGAIDRPEGADALAHRIFAGCAPTDSKDITEEDLIQQLGSGREDEAHWIFSQLDQDGNGDINLAEMVLFVNNLRTSRKNLIKSAMDIQDAVKVLDNVLSFIVFVIVVLFYAAFFSTFLSTKASTIWTFFAGGAFAIANTVGEFNACCMFVFVKHPFDVGDRVNINNIEYQVEKISLLYSVLKRIDNATVVGIGNQVLAAAYIENVSRSQAMKERIQISISPDTTWEEIEHLRVEMEKFVRDETNSRHFQPDIDINLMDFKDLKAMDLRLEILHKSNWADERLRQERRSRFMCGLLSAMRKVPIWGPKGSDPPPGSPGCANYMVTIPHDQANEEREKWLARTEKKKKKIEGDEYRAKALDVMKHFGPSKSYETELPSAPQPVVTVTPPPPAPGPDAILPQEAKKEEGKGKDMV